MTLLVRPLRILVVEDHVATASALAKQLLRHGFAVAPANSARAALAVAHLQPFDLLITDIGLPEKNGWELFRELTKVQPTLIAIAVTGYAFPRDIQRSMEVGIRVHLTKPVTMQQVEAAIVQLFPEQAAAFVGANRPGEILGTPVFAPLPTAGMTSAVKLLYLEDDANDVALLKLACEQNEPDLEITAARDRKAFIAALQSGRYAGILSDSGVRDLFGADAVKLARSLAPNLPYVFLCGVMDDARRADLLAAKPDGIFSKDQPDDVGLALRLLRVLSRNRDRPKQPQPG
jgi:CheY-like chemotaxis protein